MSNLDDVDVLAVIPFRKGSKGCPDKNVTPVAGKPLWYWSVSAAMQSQKVIKTAITTDYILSTIAADIALLSDIYRKPGYYFLRPPHLATDDAPLDAAIIHVLDELDFHGVVVTLQPTVPIREQGLIDRCVDYFLRFPATKSLLTVNLLHFVWDGDAGQLLNPPRVNRQDPTARKLYSEDGSVYVCWADDMRASGNRVMYPVALVETPWTVDIDTHDDLELADTLLRRLSRAKEVEAFEG